MANCILNFIFYCFICYRVTHSPHGENNNTFYCFPCYTVTTLPLGVRIKDLLVTVFLIKPHNCDCIYLGIIRILVKIYYIFTIFFIVSPFTRSQNPHFFSSDSHTLFFYDCISLETVKEVYRWAFFLILLMIK